MQVFLHILGEVKKKLANIILSIGVEQSERVLSSNLLGTQTRGSTYRPSRGRTHYVKVLGAADLELDHILGPLNRQRTYVHLSFLLREGNL